MPKDERVPIVTFREIRRALRPESTKSVESVTRTTGRVADGPGDAAAMQAAFGHALRVLEAQEKVPGVLVSPDHRVASLLQTFLAQRAQEKGVFEDLSTGGKEAKFDEDDWLGWSASFFSWWKGLRPHPWLTTPEDHAIPNRARIGILGDWGTGLYGAPVVGRSIDRDPNPYDVLVHLGDVYYSGDDDEVRDRFLAHWPKRQAIHRACNSNHEMYTGGKAYFGQTLVQFRQSASYFALHNDHFVLAGLDTAYEEKDLACDQVAWLEGLVAAAQGRRVVLFSHHQPYSFFDGGHPRITTKLAGLLQQRKIFAWYWGHEHRCVLHEPHPTWGLVGRCVGHGGFPAFRDRLAEFSSAGAPLGATWRSLPARDGAPGGRVLDGPNPYLTGHEDRYGTHGYMTLEVDGAHLNEIVHAADGTRLLEQPLV